jgi:hypothetical protein
MSEHSGVDRCTITIRKGVREMLLTEFPHQTLSATIQLLLEMAIDAELVLPKSKLEYYAALKRQQDKSAAARQPAPFFAKDALTASDEIETFGDE